MVQCLNRRIDSIEKVKSETAACEHEGNNKNAKINWQFNSGDVRIKLKRFYLTINE